MPRPRRQRRTTTSTRTNSQPTALPPRTRQQGRAQGNDTNDASIADHASDNGSTAVINPPTTTMDVESMADMVVTRVIDHFERKREATVPIFDINNQGRIEEESDYRFGQHVVRSSQVFYRSSLSFACVNIKPVLPGHVLVCPLRPAKRFSDLTQPEVADLFTSVQRITNVIEKHYNATSATVAIQDGADAGQTVKHVHVHILPRKPDDLPKNDDIYHELERHDKNLEQSLLRSEEDMGKEALELRPYFK